ncbi:hypothetical protein C2E20_4698 [Micractinium conductrix]|uniref:Uncharacterized protein n=1 Tax=Micractinium conductrix TaxID=554055 RepID=A0A2P6VCR3_9CHLO|nr:hypothetical protein C2E20_4700 [Micractinium conductrix]PSC71975.1 hypothetical protein C2E20_4698 [Micractinium conductrix]|eukprot:PSC71869.1 hypothetical protein C2E20_4700 [Micractinium conductrix]
MVVCNAGLNMVPANRLLTGLTGRRVRVYKAGASPSPFRRVVHAVLDPISPSPATSPAAPNPAFGGSVKLTHLVVALGVAGVWAVLCANPLEFCVVLSSCAAAMLFVVTTCMNSIATKFDGVNTKIDASNAELRTAIAASNADVRTAIDAVGTSVANLRTDVATLQGKTEVLCDTTGKVLEAALRK